MKESLYELANHIASAKGGLPLVWQDWANEIEMDIRKLANREAQPVAFPKAKDKSQGWKIDPEYLQAIADAVGSSDDEGTPSMELVEAVLLAAAPPAPAVPEEMTGGIAMSKYKVKKSNYVQWVKEWNSCRAAMLAQPVSGGYTLNSQEIPDGWKLVPIDATRAMIDAAQRVEEDGYDAMHKAMLAAAPEES